MLAAVVAVPAFLLVGFTVFDIVRSAYLSVGRKVLWLVLVVVLPVIGTLLYLLVRPFPDPSSAAGERVTEILDLLDRRERGMLPESEFTEVTARLFDQ